MPTYPTTADWVVAQLRREDWIQRHNLANLLKNERPRVYSQVVKKMHPSELLEGTNTGISASPCTIIVAGDIHRPGYKQTSLFKYFKRVKRVPPKPAYNQLTLHRFFKKKA